MGIEVGIPVRSSGSRLRLKSRTLAPDPKPKAHKSPESVGAWKNQWWATLGLVA